jgi:hypothetical protein
MATALDIIKGAGHGVIALLGVGELYNPLGDLRSELSTANSNLQNLKNTSTFQILDGQSKVENDLFKYIQTNNSTISKTMEMYNEMSMDGIQQENLFISVLSMLVIIIIFFMVIR